MTPNACLCVVVDCPHAFTNRPRPGLLRLHARLFLPMPRVFGAHTSASCEHWRRLRTKLPLVRQCFLVGLGILVNVNFFFVESSPRDFVTNFYLKKSVFPVAMETTTRYDPPLPESSRSASKVRVTYFESKRPLTLPSPEASDAEWDDMAEPPPQQYTRQASTESGQDNPFRPDGDLSREADELVELLKGGRPISEVLKGKEDVVHHQQQSEHQQSEQASQLAGSPPRTAPSSPVKAESPDAGRINGSLTEQEKKAAEAEGGAVEIQRGVVAPVTGESQAEHVVIKKKSKCQCCVIQ